MANCPKCGYWSALLCPCEKDNERPIMVTGYVLYNRLAEYYAIDFKHAIEVANICDNVLDRSGKLLGEIRNRAMELKKNR